MPVTGIFQKLIHMDVLKRKDFARWQVSEKLSDRALCNAIQEMEAGLIDADLGGHLYKLRFAGRVFLGLSVNQLVKALRSGVLVEVCCDQQNH